MPMERCKGLVLVCGPGHRAEMGAGEIPNSAHAYVHFYKVHLKEISLYLLSLFLSNHDTPSK